jgi:hypothetical protein
MPCDWFCFQTEASEPFPDSQIAVLQFPAAVLPQGTPTPVDAHLARTLIHSVLRFRGESRHRHGKRPSSACLRSIGGDHRFARPAGY